MACTTVLWDLDIELAYCHDFQITGVYVELITAKITLQFRAVWWILPQLTKYHEVRRLDLIRPMLRSDVKGLFFTCRSNFHTL